MFQLVMVQHLLSIDLLDWSYQKKLKLYMMLQL